MDIYTSKIKIRVNMSIYVEKLRGSQPHNSHTTWNLSFEKATRAICNIISNPYLLLQRNHKVEYNLLL